MTVAYATLPSFVSSASKTGTPGVPHFANAHRPRLQNMQPAVGSLRQLKLQAVPTACHSVLHALAHSNNARFS